MNSQDAEQIGRYIIAELAPLKDRLDATEAAIKGQMADYRFVHELVALLVDPKAAAKRLADIEAAAGKAAKVQAKLDADRAAHAATTANESAEFEALRSDALKQRATLAAELEEIRDFKAKYARDVEMRQFADARAASPDLSGTLVRDVAWQDRNSDEPDAHFRTVPAGVFQHPQGAYLRQSHVRAYFEAERKAVLDAICAGNPASLKDIRDTSGNAMARVNTVRALEVTRNEAYEDSRGGRGAPMAPGVVIVIESRDGRQETVITPRQAPVIEHVQEAGISDEG
jgi:hypothetical protein